MYDDTAQERVGSKAGCSNTSIFRHLKAGLLLTILSSHCHDCELLNAMRINYFLHFITSVQLLHSTCEYYSVGKGDLRGRRLQARKGKGEGSRKFGAEGSKVRKVIRHRDRERKCRLGRREKVDSITRGDRTETFNLTRHFQNEGYKMLDLVRCIFARVIPSTEQPGLLCLEALAAR